jgi:hypothetical protein
MIGGAGYITGTSAAGATAMSDKTKAGDQRFLTAQTQVIITAPVNGILTVTGFILVGEARKVLRTFIHFEEIPISAVFPELLKLILK